MAARMKLGEICNAIFARTDQFAINGGRLYSQRVGAFDHPRIASRPVKAAPCKQPNSALCYSELHPVAIMFDFMHPAGCARNFVRINS